MNKDDDFDEYKKNNNFDKIKDKIDKKNIELRDEDYEVFEKGYYIQKFITILLLIILIVVIGYIFFEKIIS